MGIQLTLSVTPQAKNAGIKGPVDMVGLVGVKITFRKKREFGIWTRFWREILEGVEQGDPT
jgi:hypothetical protein